MISDQNRQAAADSILEAEQTRKVIPQLSKTYPDMDIEDAYEIQRRWAKGRLAKGAKIVGRKIGLTSRAMQLASKMTEPDYGSDPAGMVTRAKTVPGGYELSGAKMWISNA
ncbi:MAG: hypothetical protein COB84_05585, partial [Rhodobacteraceae bacterium]